MLFSPGSRPAAFRGTFAVLLASVAFASASVAAERARPTRAAAEQGGTHRGVIAMDAASGRVLFEENADTVTPPASMTKLMTYAVLHDKLAAGAITLQTPVQIEEIDSGMGGTQVHLDPRETFPVEELIYAMMIQSANDAAHALARAAAGSREAFVELMNAKARELGMTRTRFYSPHGLPPSTRRRDDGDITTARDFALLCRHLLLKTDVLKYTSVKARKFGTERVNGATDMINHNKLLGKVTGVDGLKTGYTRDARYCLSATAERGGRRVIVVVMGAFPSPERADTGTYCSLKATELLEMGFSAVPPGTSQFAAERAKYTGPAVIPLDSPVAPAQPGSPAAQPAASSVPKITLPVPARR